MAANIHAEGDTIKIEKAFVSGKDRISVNGEIVFEGKLVPDSPQKIAAGSREYVVETRLASKMMKTVTIHLQIFEQGKLSHEGMYDQLGKPATPSQAKANSAIQVCGMIGAVIGLTVMLSLNMSTGVVPGGAIGGAIGGGGGGAIGYAIGSLLFGRRK